MFFHIEKRSLICESCSMKLSPEDYVRAAKARKRRKTDPDKEAKAFQNAMEGLLGGNGSAAFCCFSGKAVSNSDRSGEPSDHHSCGLPSLYSEQFRKQGFPDLILPFEKDEKSFMTVFRKRAREKLFVPDAFLREARPENLRAVYVPFWVFDASIKGDLYYTAETVRPLYAGVQAHTLYQCSASGSQRYAGVSQNASSRFGDRMAKIMLPFNTAVARPFHPAWISGLYTEDCDIKAPEAYRKFKWQITDSFDRFLGEPASYHAIRYDTRSYTVKPLGVRYALFPFWTMDLVWKGRSYSFVMNGQTGKCYGEFPESIMRPLVCHLSLGFLSGSLGMLAAIPFRTDPMTLVLLVMIFLLTAVFIRYAALRFLFRTNITSALSAAVSVGLGCYLISQSGPLYRIIPAVAVVMLFFVYLFLMVAAGQLIRSQLLRKEIIRVPETGCDDCAVSSDNKVISRNRRECYSENSVAPSVLQSFTAANPDPYAPENRDS